MSPFPLSPLCISSTPAPPMASLSLPLSLPHQVSAPLSPSLSYSSVFSLPPPLPYIIQLYNHIIKQHYCICNCVWIISRWTALPALNSFSLSPLSFRGELVLFKWDEWWRGEPMVHLFREESPADWYNPVLLHLHDSSVQDACFQHLLQWILLSSHMVALCVGIKLEL